MTMEKWAKAIKSRELRQIEYLWANKNREQSKKESKFSQWTSQLCKKKMWPPSILRQYI